MKQNFTILNRNQLQCIKGGSTSETQTLTTDQESIEKPKIRIPGQQ